jgi:hypothetical protein
LAGLALLSELPNEDCCAAAGRILLKSSFLFHFWKLFSGRLVVRRIFSGQHCCPVRRRNAESKGLFMFDNSDNFESVTNKTEINKDAWSENQAALADPKCNEAIGRMAASGNLAGFPDAGDLLSGMKVNCPPCAPTAEWNPPAGLPADLVRLGKDVGRAAADGQFLAVTNDLSNIYHSGTFDNLLHDLGKAVTSGKFSDLKKDWQSLTGSDDCRRLSEDCRAIVADGKLEADFKGLKHSYDDWRRDGRHEDSRPADAQWHEHQGPAGPRLAGLGWDRHNGSDRYDRGNRQNHGDWQNRGDQHNGADRQDRGNWHDHGGRDPQERRPDGHRHDSAHDRLDDFLDVVDRIKPWFQVPIINDL